MARVRRSRTVIHQLVPASASQRAADAIRATVRDLIVENISDMQREMRAAKAVARRVLGRAGVNGWDKRAATVIAGAITAHWKEWADDDLLADAFVATGVLELDQDDPITARRRVQKIRLYRSDNQNSENLKNK